MPDRQPDGPETADQMVHNTVNAATDSRIVQAGSISGGIHFYAASAAEIDHVATMPVGQAAAYMSKLPSRAAAATLAAMEVTAAGRRLAAMSPDFAASVLADMDERLAVQRLTRVGFEQMADIFVRLPLRRSAELLFEMASEKPSLVWPLLTALRETDARSALGALSASAAVDVLAAMRCQPVATPADYRIDVQREELLARMPASWISEVLKVSPSDAAVALLHDMPRHCALVALRATPVERAAELLAAMPLSWACHALNDAPDDEVAALLSTMSTSDADAILDQMAQWRPRGVRLTISPAGRVAAIRRKISQKTRSQIGKVPKPGQWRQH